MGNEYYYATGKRKESVAKVFLKAGRGDIRVNNKKLEEYFPRLTYHRVILRPLELVDFGGRYDVEAKVKGGGLTGQAEAIRLGIARAITTINPELKKILKKEGLLTRDSRVKERKKPGLKGARRGPQTSKR